jgi:hypothetical protein
MKPMFVCACGIVVEETGLYFKRKLEVIGAKAGHYDFPAHILVP